MYRSVRRHYHSLGRGFICRQALRADWREMMTRTRRELGFEFVRFHGLLDDDMSTYTVINGQLQFSFFNVDSIFDFLLSIDMKPLVELRFVDCVVVRVAGDADLIRLGVWCVCSFMPVGIASGNTTVFHYQGNTTPPSSWSQWGMVRTMCATHQHTHDPSRSLLLSCSLACCR